MKQDNKDRLSYYEEPYDFLEQANDIKNKLKISISSRKMLNDAIEIINSYLKDSEIYQILKIYNNYDNDYKVIITLMNNLTIIIKGQYLINILTSLLQVINIFINLVKKLHLSYILQIKKIIHVHYVEFFMKKIYHVVL